ncbi:hypothetical protein [Marinifilum caeruleilacunae]|uniref:DUF4890 domain-containing protein n=1 Tax=Marinifilum caeruleilacunae TaxID=2499076 RepID=A0ABX1X0U2_9BACT|nr:hypothetical protein [Marinifilum caeruleilacunae]NOU61929.1 hypothetical protein [Marinifilum caeruleilacunae]
MNVIKASAILFMAIGMLFSSNLVQAQRGGQQGPKPIPNSTQIKKMIQELVSTLDLNADQSKEISDLYTAHFEDVKEIFESGRPSRKEMENLKKKFEEDIKSVLSEEQQEEYEEYLEKNKSQRSGPPQRGRK